MKKYSFILCIALVAFVVASCGLKGKHTSSGRAYELLVVVDHGVWDRAAGRDQWSSGSQCGAVCVFCT